jgi:hypothetical protein
MKKASAKKTPFGVSGKKGRIDRIAANSLRQTKIEQLKEMIENEEYVNEAIQKLAGSLTTGLMK